MSRQEWVDLHEPAVRVEVMQNYGEILILDDAASRQHLGVIRDVCKSLNITPRRLDPLPDRAQEYLRDAVSADASARRDLEEPLARSDAHAPVLDKGPYPYGV